VHAAFLVIQMVARSSRTAKSAIVAFSFLVLLLLSRGQAVGDDSREAIHRKILAGDELILNPRDPVDTRTIDAKWIKESVANHVRVAIHYAVIRGSLDMPDETFEQRFELHDCVVRESADFSYAIFKRQFTADRVTFLAGVSFRGTKFDQDAWFGRSRFESGDVEFQYAHFLGDFAALDAEFVSKSGSGMANFSHVRFDGEANFGHSLFGIIAYFIGAQFGGQTYFDGTRFQSQESQTDFSRAHFSDVVSFGTTPFNKQRDSTFASKASFVATQFDSTAWFDGVTFENEVQFSTAKFGAASSFRGTTFKSECDFSLVWFGSDSLYMGARFWVEPSSIRLTLPALQPFPPTNSCLLRFLVEKSNS